MSLSELVRDTMAWAVRARLLPRYRETGPFVERHSGDPALALLRGQQMLVHFAQLDGDLYADGRSWQSAVRMIEAFITARDGRRKPPWSPLLQTDIVAAAEPRIVLDALESAFRRGRLSISDRRDMTGDIVASIEGSSSISDLPEPLGKWYQHKERRARWEEVVSLRLEATASVQLNHQGGQQSGPTSRVVLKFSAPCPTMAADIVDDLRGIDRLRLRGEMQEGRRLEEDLAFSLREWLARL